MRLSDCGKLVTRRRSRSSSAASCRARHGWNRDFPHLVAGGASRITFLASRTALVDPGDRGRRPVAADIDPDPDGLPVRELGLPRDPCQAPAGSQWPARSVPFPRGIRTTRSRSGPAAALAIPRWNGSRDRSTRSAKPENVTRDWGAGEGTLRQDIPPPRKRKARLRARPYASLGAICRVLRGGEHHC